MAVMVGPMTDVATMIVPGPDGITDFTEAHPPIQFRIDEDVFSLVPGLSAMAMVEFVQLAGQQNESDDPSTTAVLMQQMYRMVLTDDCIEHFLARMADREHPITLWQVQKITPWMLEQMGLRPTEPSGSSSDGQPNPTSGLNSTENAPPAESTLDGSLSLVSSTTSTGS